MMLLHSALECEWLLSTTAIDDGTKQCCDRHAVERCTPALKPLILCLPCPVKNDEECTVTPPIVGQPVAREQAIEYDMADADAPAHLDELVNLACRDKESDCSNKVFTEGYETDASASVHLNEGNTYHCLELEING